MSDKCIPNKEEEKRGSFESMRLQVAAADVHIASKNHRAPKKGINRTPQQMKKNAALRLYGFMGHDMRLVRFLSLSRTYYY